MKLSIVLCLVLAACGSDKSEPKGETPEAKPTAPEAKPEAKPVPPKPVKDLPTLTRELRAIESVACTCEDRACAEAASKEYAVLRAGVEPHIAAMEKEEKQKHIDGRMRWLDCTLRGGKRVEEIRQVQKATCDCKRKDTGCLRKTADDIGDVLGNGKVQAWFSDEELQEFAVEATKCLLKAGMKPEDVVAQGIPQKYVDAAAN